MTEQLPISITVHRDLSDKFGKIKSVCNKLEAQFNFQTLMENWYGNEKKILLILLALETPSSFKQCKISLENPASNGVDVNHFSDDVVSCFNSIEQLIKCHISITGSEIDLLTSQPKLLAGYLDKKLHKVLNLIANEQKLPAI